MSVMDKLGTAVRGSVREMAEGIIDTNALRIFGQEIKDVEKAVSDSKQKLAMIIAEKMQMKRELDTLQEDVQQKEQNIANLLTKGKESDALKVAQTIAEIEVKLSEHKKHHATLASHEQSLQKRLKDMVARLQGYRNEYRVAKATERMQKAQGSLSKTAIDTQSPFGNMQESLERIQRNQQQEMDYTKAMEQVEKELSDDTEAEQGGDSAAMDILERIRNK